MLFKKHKKINIYKKSVPNYFQMKNITKEEISTLIAKEIRELDMSGVFNEDTLSKMQEKVSSRIGENDKVLEEEVLPEQETGVEIAPSENPVADLPTAEDKPVVTPSEYEPELPNFMDKIEPAKFIVFDMNEVALGGEQLSNKPFRLFSDPDTKKSIHDAWKEEGKKTGEIYIAKFEKIGNVEFDYKNGTSHFTEKRFENPEDLTTAPSFQDNPYASESTPQEISPEDKSVEAAVTNAVDVEGQVKSYIEDILKQHFAQLPAEEAPAHTTGTVEPEEIAPLTGDPDAYNTVQDDVENTEEVPVLPTAIQESDIKYKDIVMNDNDYMKVDTPKTLKESIKNGSGEAKLLSKNDQVQTWMFEGVEYYLPAQIMSDKKCHTKIPKTL